MIGLLTHRSYLELRTGQLVKDEYFTLFEAVGALEVCDDFTYLLAQILEETRPEADSRWEFKIMDPKMDSGYIGPGKSHAQALEDDYDIMRELGPEELVGIMDQLLCHEVGICAL